MRIAAGIVLVLGLLLAVFAVATRGHLWTERSDRDRGAPDANLKRRAAPEEEKTARPEATKSETVAKISGVVVREDGTPLQWLRIGAQSMTYLPTGLVNDRLWSGDVAETTCDEHGRFELEVPKRRRFVVRSLDPAWILQQDALLRAGAGEARVVAHPAISLTGRIVDLHSGEPVGTATIEMTVTADNGNDKSVFATVEGERVGLQWRLDGDSRSGFEITARVEAEGYRQGEARIRLGAGESRAELHMRLEPLPLPCVHVLEFVNARGQAVTQELVSIVAPSGRRGGPVIAASGRVRLTASEGTHMVVVKPREPTSRSVRWTGRIEFRPGREDRTRCVFPPFAVIELQFAGEKATIEFESDQESMVLDFVARRRNRYVCPPGEWKIRLVGSDREPERVIVYDGDEITVDLTGR